MSYFTELVINRQEELPTVPGDNEAGKRILYILKHTMNGSMCLLLDTSEDIGFEVAAVSPEFTAALGYTKDDLNDDWNALWHPEDLNVVNAHNAAHLAAPFAARVVKKGQNWNSAKWHKIDGLSWITSGRTFRAYIFAAV